MIRDIVKFSVGINTRKLSKISLYNSFIFVETLTEFEIFKIQL